jgi:hypothetical protein
LEAEQEASGVQMSRLPCLVLKKKGCGFEMIFEPWLGFFSIKQSKRVF